MYKWFINITNLEVSMIIILYRSLKLFCSPQSLMSKKRVETVSSIIEIFHRTQLVL